MNDFIKDHAGLRQFLLAKELYGALRALEFAQKYHTGTRRNGEAEFSHQLGLVKIIKCLPQIDDIKEKLITVAFIHDVREDYGVSAAEIRESFGNDISEAVDKLTKKAGEGEIAYIMGIRFNLLSALVKGADRIHNLSTAKGAFSQEKMAVYLEESREIEDCLKYSQRNWPERDSAFASLRLMLGFLIGALEIK